jgi:hypothetical protein
MLEGRKVRHGLKSSFYLAKVKRDAHNDQAEIHRKLENDILPPYSLDGVLVYFSYLATAFATNPKVLTAIRYQDRVTKDEPNSFDAKIMLPNKIITPIGEIDYVEVKVLLNFDAKDITKVLPEDYAQVDVSETKVLSKIEGMTLKDQEGKGLFKMIIMACIVGAIIVGAVTIVAMTVLG